MVRHGVNCRCSSPQTPCSTRHFRAKSTKFNPHICSQMLSLTKSLLFSQEDNYTPSTKTTSRGQPRPSGRKRGNEQSRSMHMWTQETFMQLYKYWFPHSPLIYLLPSCRQMHTKTLQHIIVVLECCIACHSPLTFHKLLFINLTMSSSSHVSNPVKSTICVATYFSVTSAQFLGMGFSSSFHPKYWYLMHLSSKWI